MHPRPSHIQSFVLILVVAVFTLAGPIQAAQIVDSENREVNFEKPFSRIISLYPAHTENLLYMGLNEELIGIGTSDNYPPSIDSIKRYSYRDNVELFLAAAPDLILIRPMISRSQPELIEKLRQAGITVVSLQPTHIDELFSYWQALGALCGKNEQAAKMITAFKSRLKELRTLVPADPQERPMVYFEAIHSKMKTFSPSAISIFVLTEGGGRNIAADAVGRNNSNIAPYGKERILSKADKIDVFLSQVGRMNRVSIDDIYTEPGFRLIKAVQNKSVFLLKEELVSRPTMRLLQGIEEIQDILYKKNTEAGQDLAGLPR